LEIRHNTSLLEKAVEHSVQNASIPSRKAEAAAKEVEARAQALRRLATGGGIALAAVGIGLGVWLALRQPTIENPIPTGAPQISTLQDELSRVKRRMDDLASENARLHRQLEDRTTPTPGNEELVRQVEELTAKNEQLIADLEISGRTTEDLKRRLDSMTGGDPLTDYSIFKRRVVALKGVEWEVTTGHEFASNSEKQWRTAWCYVNPEIDNVRLNVDLVRRSSPDEQPIAPVATQQTLSRAGLSTEDALYLGSQCDWLDGKSFSQGELGGGQSDSSKEPSTIQLGDVLRYEGEINQAFLDTLRVRDFKTLRIASDGGSVIHALEAGRLLRQTGKAVVVVDRCFSACVFVVAGGNSREAEANSQIGVHQFYSTEKVDGDTATSDAQRLSSAIVRYLEENGVNPDLFHEMVKVPADQIQVIPRERLLEWRLLSTGITPTSDPPKTRERAVFEARDMIGGDAATKRGVSQADCETTCRSDSLCRAFTYDRWNRLCLIKSELGLLRVEPRSVTVVLSGPTPRESSAPLQIMKRNGRAFPDSPYKTARTGDYDDCAQSCMNDTKCLGINYINAAGRCEMFDTPSEYSPRDGVSIGVKYQQGEQ
jgi:hypothetical protein